MALALRAYAGETLQELRNLRRNPTKLLQGGLRKRLRLLQGDLRSRLHHMLSPASAATAFEQAVDVHYRTRVRRINGLRLLGGKCAREHVGVLHPIAVD